MIPKSMVLCALGMWAVAIAGGAWGTQSANQAQNQGDPSQAEIDEFCQSYGKWSKAKRLQFKPQYEQYCQKQPEPVQPARPAEPAVTPRIDRLAAPSCIERGSTLEIRGDHLDSGELECRLSRRGRSVALDEAGRSADRYRFRVQDELEAGKDYKLRCRLAQGPRREDSLAACRVARIEPRPEEPAAPVLPRPDLVVDLARGIRLAPGQSLASVRMDAMNRGDANAQGYGLAVFVTADPNAIRERPVAMLRGSPRHRLVAELPFGPALAPGTRRRQAIEGEVPQDLDLAGQFLCVRIDPLNRVAETDEGNNVTCERVRTTRVAEGNARPDLAGVFGSKVGEVMARDSIAGDALPGWLRQTELGRVAEALERHGTRRYRSWVLDQDGGSEDTGDRLDGLMLLREPGYLTPLGGSFYDDGRGNLLYFGQFGDKQATAMPFGASFFGGGGMQVAVDRDRDGLVDATLTRGLDERFRILGTLEMEWLLECLARSARAGGERDLIAGLENCLGGGTGRSGGGGGEGGGSFSGFADKYLEPDCGEGRPGGPPGVVVYDNGPTHEDFGHDYREEANSNRRTADMHRDLAESNRNKGDRRGYHRERHLADRYDELADQADRVADNRDFADAVAADSDSTQADRIAAEVLYYDSVADYVRERSELLRDKWGPRRGSGSAGQPGRGTDALPSGDDPRCRPESEWNRLLSCKDPIACIEKMNDALAGVTDGQCRSTTGPDDETTVECEENESMRECVANGDDPVECAREHGGGGDGGFGPGGSDAGPADDPGHPGGGPSSNVSYLDAHPFGATLAAMCRGGAPGFCGGGPGGPGTKPY